MVLPLAALLPVAGATLGGIAGYQQSGGNVGSALLGSGLGALGTAGLAGPLTALGGRMAGTALGARLAPEAFKAQQAAAAVLAGGGVKGAQAAATQAGLAAPMMQQMAGSDVLAKTLAGAGGLGAAALAGKMAGKAGAAAAGQGPASAAGTGAQGAAGLLGYRAPGEPNYAALGAGAVPDLGAFGPGGTLSTPISVLGPTGMAQRLEMLKSTEAQRDALRMLTPEILKAAEFAKKADLQRSLAAAGVRQNIVTAANMLERSQQAAQQMGATAANQIGSALTSQYQYS